MSTYPGDGPPNGEQPADDAAGTEPTQPVGYWERQAAERAREQAQQGRPDPTTPYPQGSYPQGDQTPYGQQHPYAPTGQQYGAAQPGAYGPPPGQPGPYPY